MLLRRGKCSKICVGNSGSGWEPTARRKVGELARGWLDVPKPPLLTGKEEIDM